ncbi:MAG TPA: arginine--tRNA ligase [Thermovirgaceae bacterium]|nr:arginine--tRNA ligase [Thermovirgaceae bacterium]
MKRDITEVLREMLERSIGKMACERGIEFREGPGIEIERTRREGQGDWATNAAMQWARIFREKPLSIAEKIVSGLEGDPLIEKIEIAGPGFINFYLSDSWMSGILGHILEHGDDFGRVDTGGGRKVQVEFVSANPTGPLHVGHGRGAAVGDICARILSFAGWDVQREYYINDAGLQMDLLGRSTQARYFEIGGSPEKAPFPEDGYKGDYIYDLARDVMNSEGDRFLLESPDDSFPFFKDFAGKVILDGIKKDLSDFGVEFDVWFSERSLYDGVRVPAMLETLKKNGFAFDSEGATWFKATAFSDDKDRVLIRSNGVPTYFASDIAYHKDKYDRGFDMVIDVWGADHHGYIPRMKAAVQALGRKESDLQILLIQFVNLLRGGRQVSMSTRSGEFVTLREVIDEVGVSATRYFFAMRRSDSHLDFDLDLAKSSSNENPVFYVQYAHARIHSILREAESRETIVPSFDEANISLLEEPEEIALIKRLSAFPEEVEKAADDLSPHRIVYYAYDLAGDFHTFYNAHRVLGVEPDLEKARLLLSEATRIVLSNALNLLGISAPEQM